MGTVTKENLQSSPRKLLKPFGLNKITNHKLSPAGFIPFYSIENFIDNPSDDRTLF